MSLGNLFEKMAAPKAKAAKGIMDTVSKVMGKAKDVTVGGAKGLSQGIAESTKGTFNHLSEGYEAASKAKG